MPRVKIQSEKILGIAFANTSPFDAVPQRFKETLQFEYPTSDTTKLTSAISLMAERLYRVGV
ncbi:hypothetical protein AB4393_18190 [Vibrio splendidus]|uniref:hypothetical protein n=1 Tax=Vibrio TaxID=662 RepID=UPI001F518D69|nr:MULTISPECIES: hypothetical protein [Vibrio]